MSQYKQAIILRVLTTNNCNHNCCFCHNEGQSISRYHYLEPNAFRIILSALKEFEIKQIQFSGGEPLLNPNFNELLNIAEQIRPKAGIGMATNGVLLDALSSKVFANKMNNIRINLPILNSSKYRKIIGTDDLNQVINAVDTLVSLRASVGINSVYIEQTDQEIIGLLEFAVKRKIDIKFLEYVPFVKTNIHNQCINILHNTLLKISAKHKHLSKSVKLYEVANGYNNVNVRVVNSFCTPKDICACREYSEIRLLPNQEFQPCLVSNNKNVPFNLEDKSSISRAFRTAYNQLGSCTANK